VVLLGKSTSPYGAVMATSNTTPARRAYADMRACLARPAWRAPGWPRARGRLAVLYLGCLLLAGAYGVTLLLPAFVKAAGSSQAQGGLIYWCGALGACGALMLSGRITDRIGAAKAAAAGAGLYAVATGVLAEGGPRSASAYASGVLLGAGWALAFTAAPIAASAMPGTAPASSRFQMLAGFNALGIGTGPIAGQMLVSHGVSYRDLFALAAVLCLAALAMFWLLARLTLPTVAAVGGRPPAGGLADPVPLVLAPGLRPFLVMVGLGACVFATMTTGQDAFAAGRGLSPSIFYACYTIGVIIPRFTVTGLLAKCSPGRATTTLLAGMCLSLSGFLIVGDNPALYAACSLLLGITYGLAYPLIQARAASGAPEGLRHRALCHFSLAYFAGVYGFPLIASAITALGGYQVLVTTLVAIATLELTISIKTNHRPSGVRTRPAPRPRSEQGRSHLSDFPEPDHFPRDGWLGTAAS
jgi:fucose permease